MKLIALLSIIILFTSCSISTPTKKRVVRAINGNVLFTLEADTLFKIGDTIMPDGANSRVIIVR